jgi:hypothetical protein
MEQRLQRAIGPPAQLAFHDDNHSLVGATSILHRAYE